MAANYSTDFACHDAIPLGLRLQHRPDLPSKANTPIEAMEKLLNKRRARQAEAPTPAPQMELDKWPEALRGVPNVFLRSPLFSATHKPTEVDRMELVTLGEVEIAVTGVLFSQKDLDYLAELLHLQRLQPLSQPIRFKANSLLKSLRVGVGNYQHTELKDAIARLDRNKVEIRIKKQSVFEGSFIEKFQRDDNSKEFSVLLNPQLLNLFNDGYTRIDVAQRRALRKHMLAKALHGMYSSHAAPFPFKVETIRDLTGSTTKDLSKFRQQLRNALTALKDDVKTISDFKIDSRDLVNVTRVLTPSQQRHMARKRVK